MNSEQMPTQPAQQPPQPKLIKRLKLHRETIKELTDQQLHDVAGGTSSTISIILISLREHICL